MEVNLHWLHNPNTGVRRKDSNNGSGWPVNENAHFIALEQNATAKDVADGFLREVWKLHGVPTEIISDMDAKFSREFRESLCKSLNKKRRMSTAYDPQTDGQTKRTNQVLEDYLPYFVNYDQNDWYQLLPIAEHAYNKSVTNAHRMSPF